MIETTETHGTIEGEYRGWYAGADTKARLDDLKTYAHDAYRAKALMNYEHTASTDFSKPYSMSIEMKDAPVGFTDLETAAVGINVANIAARLPEYFDSRLTKDDGRRPTRAPRTWCSSRSSPSGVTASSRRPGSRRGSLPANNIVKLGPARADLRIQRDGRRRGARRLALRHGQGPLHARRDRGAAQGAARARRASETLLIAFDQIGVALRADGDFKGALQANDALVAKYPRKAVHRLRSASALLEAGLGTRAQREALAATKLEPKSALAWKTLGWMLQHDAVGRRFGEGFDRAGAIAAYRKARALEPLERRHRRGSRGAARARRQRRALFATSRISTKRSPSTRRAASC